MDWKTIYEAELKTLLKTRTGAEHVVIFDHTVRVDDEASERKPARNVHTDYSAGSAHDWLRKLVGEEAVYDWDAAHFAFINVWRPIDHIIQSAPLAFIRPRSVAPEDWITLDLIYADREGEIMGLAANEAHEWVFMSHMSPEEVAMFNIHDNRGRPSVPNSALDLIDGETPDFPRKSIESRALVRFA